MTTMTKTRGGAKAGARSEPSRTAVRTVLHI